MEIRNGSRRLTANHARRTASNTNGAERTKQAESTSELSETPATLPSVVLRELQELPEVRSQLIAEARESVDSGEYLTLRVARATASELLNAG